MIRFLLAFALAVSPLACALAAPGDSEALVRAINNAKRKEPVMIPAGDYDITDLKIRRSVHLVGQGEVVFFSSRPVEKGLLNPLEGVSLTVENITFRDAQSPDLNGAGIRNDGDDLTVVNCVFIGNEDGILSTGSPFGRIRIERSAFIDSGHGDGYSHAVYVSEGESLEVESSRFSGTKAGHHVKSLARVTRVANSQFDDTGAHTSYALDVSAGGDVSFTGNTVIKSADADNATIINYELTRGGKATALAIENNRIINRNPNARLLRNDTDLKPSISNNEIINEGKGRLNSGGR
ncbi:MAG: hypothetical protein VX640_16100 [Pseudomonadota bacterium]|nr:hypothetical protein [Pseudomonadota bacterium]